MAEFSTLKTIFLIKKSPVKKDFFFQLVPIVQKTWAPLCRHIEFYSDVQDDRVPTVALGVNNTLTGWPCEILQSALTTVSFEDIYLGHCAKTWAIFRRFLQNERFAKLKWLFVADDDTLLR